MKQTEIGLIPDDWEVKTLNDYFDIGSSKRVFQSQWRKSGIPFYRAREIVILAEKNSVENELFIDENLYNQYKILYGVPAINDLLVTGVGTLGKVYKVQNNKPFYFKDGNIICLKNKGNIDSDYVKYHFDYPIVKDQINDNSGKSTVGTYTINSARNTTLPIPPLAEQQRIAKALSDVDVLISTTEKLIQKKKNIKQGTMQNLLTGEKRLPGFGPQNKSPAYKQTEFGLIPEDWEVMSLGEICVINPASSNIIPDEFFYVDLESVSSGKLEKKQKIRRRNAPSRAQRQFEKNDILYQTVRPYQRNNLFVNFDSKNYIASTGYAIIRTNNNDDAKYIYQIIHLDNFVNIVLDNCTGTSYPAINPKFLKTIPVLIPKKEEQTAIANVLSSMDKEIETLNTKLEKYRNLKTAMMQQLLTGKIRLVK